MSDSKTQEIAPVEYARACGVTIGYVYSQIWGGRLPARKDGKKWRIPVSAIPQRIRPRSVSESDAIDAI